LSLRAGLELLAANSFVLPGIASLSQVVDDLSNVIHCPGSEAGVDYGFSLFGDMQDNSKVTMYFGCFGPGTRSFMVDSSINIFHWVSHTSNESFLFSMSKVGACPCGLKGFIGFIIKAFTAAMAASTSVFAMMAATRAWVTCALAAVAAAASAVVASVAAFSAVIWAVASPVEAAWKQRVGLRPF
jgi:hypothetical protein